MPVVQFSQRDINRGRIIDPAWYRVRIDTIGEVPTTTAKGPSINYPVEAVILFNGDTGAKDFTDCPIDWTFNSKAIGFAVGLLKALGVEVTPDKRFELKSCEGREVDVYIENDTYQNRLVNKMNHKYREVRADISAVD